MIESARYSAWFQAHVAALQLYARQWLDHAQAEDAVHEAFVALLSQAREPDNARAWLFKVVRRRAIAQARSNWRRQRRQAQAVQSNMFESLADDLIDARAAEAALWQLPIEQREIVVLRIWAGLRFGDIAELTGSNLSTVFDRYGAALTALREKLERSPCPTNPK